MKKKLVNLLDKYFEKNKRAIFLTGDLGFGMLDKLFAKYTDRIINVGIAEQNMMGIASGLALNGIHVFCYSIGNFSTLRCLEQIRNDIAYYNLPVTVIAAGCGFSYGALGMSHHATEDISIMRAIPNVDIYSPADINELEFCFNNIINKNRTAYLRIGRGNEPIINKKISITGNINKIYDNNNKNLILCSGPIANECLKAKFKLKKEYNIDIDFFSLPIVDPIERSSINILDNYNNIFCVEEHNLNGGVGSTILENITNNSVNIERIGINNKFISSVGDMNYLREKSYISSDFIVQKIKQVIK